MCQGNVSLIGHGKMNVQASADAFPASYLNNKKVILSNSSSPNVFNPLCRLKIYLLKFLFGGRLNENYMKSAPIFFLKIAGRPQVNREKGYK